MPQDAPLEPNQTAQADRQRIAEFMQAWEAGRNPAIGDFAPARESSNYQATLRELIVRDLEQRWKQPVADDQATLVRPPSAESYIRQFALADNEDLADEIAQEEFIVRRRFGDAPEVQEFVDRFPRLASAFSRLDQRYPLALKSASPGESWLQGVPQLANYEIIRPLGEGGMGSVYFARQLEPVRRDVALKVIRCGTDSPELIARFEAERQALAMMDHPRIAKVLDGGVTQTGLPYFAMEYVDGTTITDFCQATSASLEQRLELFMQTCRAVQHAHQKGILHRDLKPSNILVTSGGEQPTVKVIDFGLAKAVRDQAALTANTLHTQLGQIVGTPQYMSPEQASPHQLDVDTRSDVYSLGTVLYELLAGTPPLERSFLQSQALDEILRAIREVEPEKPSLRVKREDLASDSRVSSWTKSKLSQSLSGDLDWIVMRAIEKDRERRYESPLAIAHDVQRYRKLEPVSAGPPSTLYRVRKFVRRYAVSLSIAGTFLALLIGGAIVTSLLGWRAIEAEKQAFGNLQKALQQETIALENEAKAKQLALESQHQAASLALRQAEASMDSSDVAQGLLWYLNALQMAPRRSSDLRRVARWNLQTWSPSILPVVQQRDTGEVFYLEEGSPFFYEQTEMVGNDIFAKLAWSESRNPNDTNSSNSQAPEQPSQESPEPAAYIMFDGDTFQPKFGPIVPSGLPFDYWIDAASERLITLHTSPDDETNAAALQSESTADDREFETMLGREIRSGKLTLEQWSLNTGESLAKPMQLAGGYLDSLDTSFAERSIEIDMKHNHLFHFAPHEQVARLYDLTTAELLQPPIQCLTADLSQDGYVLTTGHEDGEIRRYILRDGQFQAKATYRLNGELLQVHASNSVRGGKCSNAIMAIDQDYQVHVWDQSGEHYSQKTSAPVRGVRASGDVMFVGLGVGAIAGWNVATDEVSLLQFDCDYSMLHSIHSGRFWAVSDGSELKIWDQRSSFSRPVFQTRQTPRSSNSQFVLNLDVDPHALTIAAGFLDGRQRFFEIDPESTSPEMLVREIPVQPSAVGAYVQALSQVHGRCRLISRINVEDQTEIIDCSTGQTLATISNSGVRELQIPIGPSLDGKYLNCFSISALANTPTKLIKIPLWKTNVSTDLRFSTYFVLNAHPTRQAVLAVVDQIDSAIMADDKLVTLSTTGELSSFDLAKGSIVETATLTPGYQWELLVPSDSQSRLLAASKTSHAVRLLNNDLQPLGPLIEFPSGPDSPRYFTFACSPGLSHIFVPSSGEIIDLARGSKQALPMVQKLAIETAAFNTTGQSLAISCSDATLRTIDSQSLDEIVRIQLPSVAKSLLPLADGDWLAVMSARRWLKIAGKEVVEGGVFAEPVMHAELSRDRQLMVSIHADDSLQLWDTATARRIGPPRRFRGRYLDSKFLSSGAHLAVLTDEQIAVFPLTPNGRQEPSDEELAQQIRNLTHTTVVDGRLVRLDTVPGIESSSWDSDPVDLESVEFWRIGGNQSVNEWPALLPIDSWDLTPPQEATETAYPMPPPPVVDPSS